MGLIWRIGLINCHISNRDNLEKFLVAVSLMKLDICAVVESWFKGGEGEGRMEERLRGTDWVWMGRDREGRRGGGVGFLARREAEVRVAKTSRSEGLMWVEVEDGEGKFFVAVVYRAPGSFPSVREANQELMDELSEDITFFREQGRIGIVGDFNCRIGEEESRIVSEERGQQREKIYWRRSEDKKVSHGGRELVRFMNDHNMIILNGVKKKALFSSVQIRGNSVIDYIISDQNLYQKMKNFKTWQEEISIVSDHRILTVEIEGSIRKQNFGRKSERKREKEGGEGRGWRREVRDRKNLEDICEREMQRWGEEYGKDKVVDGELAWKTWLETHNKVAEKAVGRYKRRKKRSWVESERRTD